MGTFHSFISQPLKEGEAKQLLIEVQKVAANSEYRNDPASFRLNELRAGHWVVCGVIKNLGGAPLELLALDTEHYWTTISDEGDLFNSQQ